MTHPLSASSLRPQRISSLATYEVEDDLVLYDPSGDAVHVLNPTAAFVWDLCDGSRTVEEIARELSDLYRVPYETVAQDVQTIIQEFVRSRVAIM